MPFGALNPFPFQVGGGRTETDKAHRIIRNAVGKGGTASTEDGIDGLWRRSRAKGLSSATGATRRAVLQAWPHLATDAIPYYERATGVTPGVGATDEERRQEATAEFTAQLSAVIPAVAGELAAVDSRLSVLNVDDVKSSTTVAGRVFGPLANDLGEDPFGGDGFSAHPNYSSHFTLYVLFNVGYVTPLTAGDSRKLEQVQRILRKLLPSWVSFYALTSTGFLCGDSPLGLTGVTD